MRGMAKKKALKKVKTLKEKQEEIARLQREVAQEQGSVDKDAKTTDDAPSGDPLDGRESDFDLVKDTRMVTFRPQFGAELMGKPKLREQDQKPQRFFFYKRLTDDKEFCYTEAEAALMMQSNHAMILRQLGCSDGTAYWKYIRTCGLKDGQRVPIEKAKEVLRGAYAAERAAAMGNYAEPMAQNIHFDSTVRRHRNAQNIIQGFSPM